MEEQGKFIHCIICGKPLYTDKEHHYALPKGYVCGMCYRSFESDYLIHRINCFEKNVTKPEFVFLESRLNCSTYNYDDSENDITIIY